MSICWDCHWGWAKPVADIYLKALAALDGDETPLKHGPGHIVWSDENFDSAPWCLEHFDEYSSGLEDWQIPIVRRSLQQLAALPVELWDVCPDDYDGEHPENYPPPPGVEMVRI